MAIYGVSGEGLSGNMEICGDRILDFSRIKSANPRICQSAVSTLEKCASPMLHCQDMSRANFHASAAETLPIQNQLCTGHLPLPSCLSPRLCQLPAITGRFRMPSSCHSVQYSSTIFPGKRACVSVQPAQPASSIDPSRGDLRTQRPFMIETIPFKYSVCCSSTLPSP